MASDRSSQPFSKLVQGFARNDKLRAVPVRARWAWAVSIDYCNEHGTDGEFHPSDVLGIAEATRADANGLIREGLWHKPGHTCTRCPQPRSGKLIVHDFLQHQTSREQRERVAAKRAAAGRKGAQSRYQKPTEPPKDTP